MTDATGKTALITGASAGLGRELALLFAADGHKVVLVARRSDRLDELAKAIERDHGVEAVAIAADLAAADAPSQLFRKLEDRDVAVEFLVNNAGFGTCGAFTTLDEQGELAQIAVNVTALTHLSRLFLPGMLARGSGRILNVGSTAGFLAGPYMATYYATKAFVNSLSEALAHEVAGSGVTVTVSCPGPTETEFAKVAGNDGTRLFQGKTAGAAEVAGEAYDAMMRGRRMIVHGAKNRASMHGLRILPRKAVHRIAAKLNRAPKQA